MIQLEEIETRLIAHDMHLSMFNKKVLLDVASIDLTLSKPQVDIPSSSDDPSHSIVTAAISDGSTLPFQTLLERLLSW